MKTRNVRRRQWIRWELREGTKRRFGGRYVIPLAYYQH